MLKIIDEDIDKRIEAVGFEELNLKIEKKQ